MTGESTIDATRLIAAALAGIVLLMLLILRGKLHAFPALLLVSALLGLAAGMTPDAVLDSMTRGMGGTLGTIAVLVGLGAMFGRMLEASGGAEALARSLLDRLGQDNAQWALGLTGFLVSIPVFFDVGFIVLVPLVYGLSRETSRPVVYFALPLLSGLAASHVFVPPTPGPIAVAGLLGADLGWVILFGTLTGLPCLVVAGPLLARRVARRVEGCIPTVTQASLPVDSQSPDASPAIVPPDARTIVLLIAAPLAMILTSTLARLLLEEGVLQSVLTFIGHPFMALLAVTLLCFYLLGTRKGYSRQQVQDLATQALEPAGIIILVTGAGGVLKQVLIDSGVGRVLADNLQQTALPTLFLAFAVAALLRLMQGSSTVAMLSAAGLVASLIDKADFSQPRLALLTVAIAAGSAIASHVNDSGFWLVSRYLGLSVADTLRMWTLATTVIAVLGLFIASGFWLLIG